MALIIDITSLWVSSVTEVPLMCRTWSPSSIGGLLLEAWGESRGREGGMEEGKEDSRMEGGREGEGGRRE